MVNVFCYQGKCKCFLLPNYKIVKNEIVKNEMFFATKL